MRALLFSIIGAAVFGAGLATAQTSLIGQADTALPGGVYTTLRAENVAACAQFCAADGICLAWTYRSEQNGACELKAVVPHAVSEAGAISGTSSRAPAFAQALAAAPPHRAETEENQQETKVAFNATAPHPNRAPALPNDDSQLLGGPDPAPDTGLRSTLPEEVQTH
ncbi:MAG: PAN domain-containing protein [Alphaproteobacteria bacterium]